MTRGWFVTLAAAPLLLAGCHRQAPEQDSAANTGAPGENYAAAVEKLPPGQLNGVLFRAIRDAGQACQQVVSVQRQPDVQGQPTWTATCDDHSIWVVVMGADGTAKVTNARDVTGAAKG